MPPVESMPEGAHLPPQSPRRLMGESAEQSLEGEKEAVLDPVADGAVLQERTEP